MKENDEMMQETGRDLKRLNAKKPASFIIGLALYGGTLGLLFILPLVAGAYLGKWLDSLAAAYSSRWTVSFILIGIAVGFFNVTHFIKRH